MDLGGGLIEVLEISPPMLVSVSTEGPAMSQHDEILLWQESQELHSSSA